LNLLNKTFEELLILDIKLVTLCFNIGMPVILGVYIGAGVGVVTVTALIAILIWFLVAR